MKKLLDTLARQSRDEDYASVLMKTAVTVLFATGIRADVEHRLLAFQRHYEALARPFEWTFTRRDLARLLNKLPDSAAA